MTKVVKNLTLNFFDPWFNFFCYNKIQMITKLYNKKSHLININILILFKINYVPYYICIFISKFSLIFLIKILNKY